MDKELENHLKEEELKKEFIDDYTNNERYKDYFSKYNERNIADFIKSMANYKANLIVNGENFVEWMEKDETYFRNLAEEALWEIQQKKLFNMQCLWRAEKIKISEIESTYDFDLWSLNIKNCKFIDPISENDIDLYIQYLHSDDIEKPGFSYGKVYNMYEMIKEEHENPEQGYFFRAPLWYQFYDTMRGTNSLFLLPDLRGDKENEYEKVIIDKRTKEYHKKLTKGEIKTETKPYISIFDKNIFNKFLDKYEDETIKNYHAEYNKMVENNIAKSEHDITYYLEILKRAEKDVPIKANTNWRLGLVNAAIKYEMSRVIDLLPKTYEEYLTYLNLGISYPLPENFEDNLESNVLDKNIILDARELLGEPRDFNF